MNFNVLSYEDFYMKNQEPYLEAAYHEWRAFYANREENYKFIISELDDEEGYSHFYKSGGFGYDPKYWRSWLL